MSCTISRDNSVNDLQNIHNGTKYIVYKSRWYVLIVFSLLSSMNSLIYGTFGPIASGMMYAYPGWTETDVSMTVMDGSVSYLVFTLPVCWVLEKIGIRQTTIAGKFQFNVKRTCVFVLQTKIGLCEAVWLSHLQFH